MKYHSRKVRFKYFLFKFFLLLVLIFGLLLSAGCFVFSGSRHVGVETDHFDRDKFYNQDPQSEHGFWHFLKWMTTRERGFWPDSIETQTGGAPPGRAATGDLRVILVNHSTVLIQVDSLNILTDPVWSERVSPVSWAGPSRQRPPGLNFSDLPPIDIVLISHNHYDHLDLPTVKKLEALYQPLFIVPLGNQLFLMRKGLKRVIELDWWQTAPELPVTFVPARHFSGRGLCDRNATLWGGFVYESKAGPVYFAGDTGFGMHFSQIFRKFGPMRLALLPIGAYKPRWFMQAMHISPAEAVEAHCILQSQLSLPIHFGTFKLADDGFADPGTDLQKALFEKGIAPEKFRVPEFGECVLVPPLADERGCISVK